MPGIMFAKVLDANAAHSGSKAVGIPVPQDTSQRPSDVTELQWVAGNWGAADEVHATQENSVAAYLW